MTPKQSYFFRQIAWQDRRPKPPVERVTFAIGVVALGIATFLLVSQVVPRAVSIPLFATIAVAVIANVFYWCRKAAKADKQR